MGRLLEKLRQQGGAAIPANPAIRSVTDVTNSRNSKNSEAHDLVRLRLLDLASAAEIDEGIVHGLRQDDVDACAAESDATLTTYLQVLLRRKAMGDGIVPEGWTAEVTCRGCGPVLLWPECPPELIACPWCLIRKAGKPLPRPK